jgi:hypothetical protein
VSVKPSRFINSLANAGGYTINLQPLNAVKP